MNVIQKINESDKFLISLFENVSHSDVTLIVEGKEFPVLRYVLEMHSQFFKSLFKRNCDDLQNREIPLVGVKLKPFEILLRYMYCGEMNILSTNAEDCIDLLSLAHMFELNVVMKKISGYMVTLRRDVLQTIAFLNKAALFGLESLQKFLIENITYHSLKFVENDVFVQFNEEAICILLESNNWSVKESRLVSSLAFWLSKNQTTRREELLSKLRLTLIDTKTLLNEVEKMKLFSDQQLLDAVCKKLCNNIETVRYHPNRPKIITVYDEELAIKINCYGQTVSRLEITAPQDGFYKFYIDESKQRWLYFYKNETMIHTFPPVKVNWISLKKGYHIQPHYNTFEPNRIRIY